MANPRNSTGPQDAQRPQGANPDPSDFLVPGAGKHAARPSEAERLESLHEDQPRSDAHVLDRILDPVSRCFTPEVARAIVNLRIDPAVQARIDDLAAKSAEGALTPAESLEYETCLAATDFLAILQAKAQALLNRNAPS